MIVAMSHQQEPMASRRLFTGVAGGGILTAGLGSKTPPTPSEALICQTASAEHPATTKPLSRNPRTA
jgi:hypothetical protein